MVDSADYLAYGPIDDFNGDAIVDSLDAGMNFEFCAGSDRLVDIDLDGIVDSAEVGTLFSDCTV